MIRYSNDKSDHHKEEEKKEDDINNNANIQQPPNISSDFTENIEEFHQEFIDWNQQLDSQLQKQHI